MLGDVGIKLSCKANEDENFLAFIRNSEEAFGMEEKDVFSMELEELDSYIEWLDYLWTK